MVLLEETIRHDWVQKEGGGRGANERSGETQQRVNGEHDCGQMWERKTRSKGCGGEGRKLEGEGR